MKFIKSERNNILIRNFIRGYRKNVLTLKFENGPLTLLFFLGQLEYSVQERRVIGQMFECLYEIAPRRSSH